MEHVIKWLLEDETPEVKYRTMTELLGMPKDGPEVRKAHENLLSSNSLGLVMDKFKLNKKWEDINALLALTEFGLNREDVPVDDYVGRAIKNLNLSMKCAKILLLRNLVSLGYYGHPWVQEQIPLVFLRYGKTARFDVWTKPRKQTTPGCRIWAATGRLPPAFYSRQS